MAALSALVAIDGGTEAQPPTVDATAIHSIPPRKQTNRLFGDIRTPIARLGAAQSDRWQFTAIRRYLEQPAPLADSPE